MDEVLAYQLGPGALDKIESADWAKLGPEEALIFRALQAGEYFERDVTEDELEQLLLWYHQHIADETLISMMMKGDIFFGGFEDDNPFFKASPQGTEKLRANAEARGLTIPHAASEQLLDGEAL